MANNNNKKETEVTASESTSSGKENASTTVLVDQIETPRESALNDQAAARKIIDRVATMEGDIKMAMMSVNVKKLYVGCLLLISKRLANSEDEEETETTAKVSLFEQMVAEKKLSRATAYRRIADARVFIESGIITNEMLDQIEKSEVTSPELISKMDNKLQTHKGIKLQQKQGLLPSPDKTKQDKVGKSFKERLDEKSKQVESLLAEIKQLLADKELTKSVGDPSVLDKLTSGYTHLDSTFLKFRTIEIPELPKLEPLVPPSLEMPSIIKP